jgi:hypothetical protein
MENDIPGILATMKTSQPHAFLHACLFMLVIINCAQPQKNNQDTLGYYKELSTPQTFLAFQSTDSIITINFLTGYNNFSEAFTGDTSSIHFEPVIVNLQRDWRKQISIELVEK